MRPVSLALCFLALLTASFNLYAANPCLSGGSLQPREDTGTGGTGRGPLQEDGTGAGGTGHGPLQQDGSGAGGTGHAPWMEAIDGSGAGGTGHATEVEGVITGFASICVNGLELHYQASTPVDINGRVGSAKDLAVGQVVLVQARGLGDQLAISSLQVRHLMVASLQDVSGGRVQAMGRTILLDKNARLPSGLASGRKVAISGFAGPGGTIIATRLDTASTDSPDSVSGEVARNSQGQWTIGGVTIDAADTSLKAGENMRAEGRFANGRFLAERVVRDEPSSRAERFVIQGLVKEAGKGRLNVADKKFAVDPAAPVKHDLPKAGAWVRVEGQRRGKELLIQKIEIQERILPDHGETSEKSASLRGKQPRRSTRSSPDQDNGHDEKSEHEENTEKIEKFEDREASPRHEKVEKSEAPETPERREKTDTPERPEKRETPEHVERPEHPEKPEHTERVERPERPEKPEHTERPERPERPETHDRD